MLGSFVPSESINACMQVVATAVAFETGQASITVKTAAVPHSGSVSVSLTTETTALPPYDGTAGLNAFKLTAEDWVGSQGRQLQYEFRYMRVNTPLQSKSHGSYSVGVIQCFLNSIQYILVHIEQDQF